MEVTTLIVFLLIGLIVGVIARLIVPGPDPMGWLGTMFLGVLGSFVGGFLSSLVFAGRLELHPSGWLGSIVGAVIVLLALRQLGGRRVAV